MEAKKKVLSLGLRSKVINIFSSSTGKKPVFIFTLPRKSSSWCSNSPSPTHGVEIDVFVVFVVFVFVVSAAAKLFHEVHIGEQPTELDEIVVPALVVFLLGDHLFFFCLLQQVDWDLNFPKFCCGQGSTVCVARDVHKIEVAWIVVLFGKDTVTQILEDSHVALIRGG